MHGFPAALTSYVGRAQAVDEIAGQLGQYRLVTVTGPGGAGKTRLAGEVAKRVAGRFADGVWLAELAAVRDPAQVTAVVAAALGIRDLPVTAAADALAGTLAGRQLLLVLDNCEQVIGAAAELCGRLLLGADDVRVLATSREPLRIAGEVRYRLGPLTLPDPDDPAAAGSEAVTLFADRARRVEPGFALDETTRVTVAELVARLDGMPLAIELAAARVDALGVAQLLDRIDDRFELLVDGDRLAQRRQRSLAAAVQWSYQLLDDAERRVFRAVSVFPGPFTLDGAEAVAGPGARRAVPRLADCSLLVPPRVGPDGRTRYAMLETLRAYGTGLLASGGEDGEVTAALVEYAAEMAEEASAGLYTRTGEAASLRQLDAEDATLRHALAWAMEHDPPTALRLALSQAPMWSIRGRLISQAPLLAAAATCADAGSDQWCGAHMLLGQAASSRADPVAALEHFTAVLAAVEDPERAESWSGSGPVLLVLCLGGRSSALLQAAPGDRGGRRCPPGAGRGPPDRLAGPGGGSPDLPGHGRLAGRRPGRGSPARAPGAGYPGRVRRRSVRAQRSLAGAVRVRKPGRAAGCPAEGPAAARAGRDPDRRGARRGHEPGHRRRVRPDACRRGAGPAGRGRGRPGRRGGRRAGPDPAQPPGTGTGHPGRAGPHRRADRGAAVHHRAHGQLAPGPGPGQDRLPSPRRPHPAGPQRRPRLSRPELNPPSPCG
jgi:predicted ATPase